MYLKLQQTELQGDVIMWLPASDPCLDAVDDSRLSRRQRNHQPVRHAQEGGDEAGGDGAAHNGVRPGPGQALPAKKNTYLTIFLRRSKEMLQIISCSYGTGTVQCTSTYTIQ